MRPFWVAAVIIVAAATVSAQRVDIRRNQPVRRSTQMPSGTSCVIPDFEISSSTASSVTFVWGTPAGLQSPRYEVYRGAGPNYCSIADPSLIATISQNTYTASLDTANTAFEFFINVAGMTCTTDFSFVVDSYTTPPQKPAAPAITVSNGQAVATFSYTDTRAFGVRLQRARAGGAFATVDFLPTCQPNPKTLVDRAADSGGRLPDGDYQYRLLLFNAAGSVVSDVVNVRVGAAVAAPVIDSFTATPTTIRAGQTATLTFATQNATSVSIDNGVGTVPATGSVTVTPTKTTTYTLTATNGSQTSTATVNISVITQPAVTISSFPAALIQATGTGGATTSYSLTNNGGAATTVTLGQTANFFTQSPTSFTLQPGAIQNITVTANAQSSGGTFDGFATISGNGVPQGLQVPIRLLSATPPNAPVVAKALDNRVDVTGAAGASPSGSVRFINGGAGVLTGTVVADVPWIIPQTSIVSIPPGGQTSVSFTIDRTKRPDADVLLGSTTGNLGLYYISNSAAGKGATGNQAPGQPPINITKASVVDTVPPNSTGGAPPQLAAGEVALFVAGVGHVVGTVGQFISDVSIRNPFSTRTVDDVKLFYTPSSGESRTANVQLATSRTLTIGDAVKTAFGQDSLGSLQIRSKDADKLSVNATVFNSSNPAGTYGTVIPTIRSDRGVGSGGNIVLTGLRADSSTHTNLYIQEVSGTGISVATEFFAADGSSLGSRSDDLGPFALRQMGSVVPRNAVSAILTPTTSVGRFQAYATPVDEASGDTWSVADWSAFYGYAPQNAVVIPVAGVLAGAGNTFFRTDAAIMNRGTGQASGTLRFFGRNGEALSQTVSLGSRQSMIISDIIGSFFRAANGAVGFVTFTPNTGSFAVTSRTYTTVANQAATFGTGVPTQASTVAIKKGQVRSIAALEDSATSTIVAGRPATFRTNYGLLETSGNPVKVRVTVSFSFPAGPKVTATGSASKDYDLGANQFLLINGLTADIIGAGRQSLGDLRDIQADFAVIDGNGAVVVFTSSVDNGTGDTILRTD